MTVLCRSQLQRLISSDEYSYLLQCLGFPFIYILWGSILSKWSIVLVYFLFCKLAIPKQHMRCVYAVLHIVPGDIFPRPHMAYFLSDDDGCHCTHAPRGDTARATFTHTLLSVLMHYKIFHHLSMPRTRRVPNRETHLQTTSTNFLARGASIPSLCCLAYMYVHQ